MGIKNKANRLASAGRAALAVLLSVALVLALLPASALAQGGADPYIGEGTATLQASSVTVDGVVVTRVALASGALSSTALASGAPAAERVPAGCGASMCEYAGLLVVSASAAGGLVTVGSALTQVFQRVTLSLYASQILSRGDPAAFVIPAGAVEGVDRNVYVVFTSATAVVVDGVAMGASWLTCDLAKYVASNYDSIQTAPAETVLADQAAAAREAFLEMAGEKLNSDGRGDILMVSIGYNKASGKVAVGVKLKKGSSKIGWLAAGSGTLTGGVPYLAVLNDAGSALISCKDYNCAEDACVSQLGGLGETEAENIVMLPPFRVNGPNGGAAAKISIQEVCEECEKVYGRHSFSEGTLFKSPMVLKE